jgi:hypothetical protein
MRRIALLVAVTALALGGQAADAKTIKSGRMTFSAAVPCTVVCAYWLAHPPERIPFVAGDGNPYACTEPFPPGSYEDKILRAPKGAKLLRFQAYPVTDWDVAFCTPGNKYISFAANTATDCQFGCVETANIKVKAGKRYLIRAYNWSDTDPLPAKYWFYG